MTIESKIYEIFTKKRYNRDEPYLKEEIKEKINYFISQNKPIKLIGFWGIGLKSKPNWADLASCEFLAKLNDEVKRVYQPEVVFL